MRIIAHRGNLAGPDPATENTPEVLRQAIALGFDVEVDVWTTPDGFALGHDHPDTPIPDAFLDEIGPFAWLHCKDLASLVALKDRFHCFFHDKDVYTLTSRGVIWGNIESPSHPQAIRVLPEKSSLPLTKDIAGVCTDYPKVYADLVA